MGKGRHCTPGVSHCSLPAAAAQAMTDSWKMGAQGRHRSAGGCCVATQHTSKGKSVASDFLSCKGWIWMGEIKGCVWEWRGSNKEAELLK